ncbi:type II toxin-antitoxin system HigB family toxin [Membranihabitans maritimus]|uniref:type II toxin-antitoxin system HigB family toxin n=1 Tax=Membranihabitans maritimus TaxID=2904244 RepID=UPI0034E1C124
MRLPFGRKILLIFRIKASWGSTNELKEDFGSASIISSKRVVFNIKGNHHRLIVDVEYRLKIIFIVWVGTHSEYDRIDVKKVQYVKTSKK